MCSCYCHRRMGLCAVPFPSKSYAIRAASRTTTIEPTRIEMEINIELNILRGRSLIKLTKIISFLAVRLCTSDSSSNFPPMLQSSRMFGPFGEVRFLGMRGKSH